MTGEPDQPTTQMQSFLTLKVLCHPESLRQVRESLLSLQLEPEVLQAVTIVANELVANSIRHSDLTEGHDIDLEVLCHGDHIRIDVRDLGTGFTPPQQIGDNGRGFPMVQALSRHFGISRNGHTHAWAEVELP